ncbi:MAG: stage III sporulation protein AG [Oscillospiraceae bacterium]|nr:stage III sporulation protein AG [Oscillospiraceae bacterium]
MTMDWKRLRTALGDLKRYRPVLLVLLAGVILLLLPGRSTRTAAPSGEETESPAEFSEAFDLAALEARLGDILSRIEGAGQVEVLLTLESGTEQVLARDSETARAESGEDADLRSSSETVIVSRGGSAEEVVVIRQLYPEFRGAAVVCEGAGDPAVCLQITRTVSALTGLGSDRISISQMKGR